MPFRWERPSHCLPSSGSDCSRWHWLLCGQRTLAVLDQLIELSSCVCETSGFTSPLKLEDGVVGRIAIAHQRARPIFQEGNRVLGPAAHAEVVHHPWRYIETAARISPDIGAFGLARATLFVSIVSTYCFGGNYVYPLGSGSQDDMASLRISGHFVI